MNHAGFFVWLGYLCIALVAAFLLLYPGEKQ